MLVVFFLIKKEITLFEYLSRALTPPDKEFKQKFKTSVKWKNLDPEYNEVRIKKILI